MFHLWLSNHLSQVCIPKILFLFSFLSFLPFSSFPSSSLSQQSHPLPWSQPLPLISIELTPTSFPLDLSCLLDSRPIILTICWTSLFVRHAGISAEFSITKIILFSLTPIQPSGLLIFVNGTNITLVMQTENIWHFAPPYPIYLTHFLCLAVFWNVSCLHSLFCVAIVSTQIYTFFSSCLDSCNSLLGGYLFDFMSSFPICVIHLSQISLPEAHFHWKAFMVSPLC